MVMQRGVIEFKGSWKDIWTQKGRMSGTADDIDIYDGWEKSSTGMIEVSKRIIDILDIHPEDKVLEVGCGAGGLGRFMKCDYVGIDYSKPLTERCMEFYRLPAINAEANNLPFKDGYFDKCFSWGVFLYFPSIEYAGQVIDEMIRVTKEGKKCIFIGDIPEKSHNENHQVYEKSFFTRYDFTTELGWAEPYCNERFNAWK